MDELKEDWFVYRGNVVQAWVPPPGFNTTLPPSVRACGGWYGSRSVTHAPLACNSFAC